MREISVEQLQLDPVKMIAGDWMLITAGNEQRGYNTMTASWGHLGSIWGHGGGLPTAVVYLRPQRYTKEFVDREELFTLTFFSEEYRKALAYLGRHSGRSRRGGCSILREKLKPRAAASQRLLLFLVI